MTKSRLTMSTSMMYLVEDIEKIAQEFREWDEEELDVSSKKGRGVWIITIEAPTKDVKGIKSKIESEGYSGLEILDMIDLD